MSNTIYGTLGIYIPVETQFTVGDVLFTVKSLRYNSTQDYYTSLLTYNDEQSAIPLFQHKETVFYYNGSRYFFWLGKRTNASYAHVFISAPKTVKISR